MPTNYSDSFNWNVEIREGRAHGWKQHGKKGTLVREVLGILDKWATANTAQGRAVFVELSGLLKVCNKGPRADGVRYSMDHLKHVLVELRARHIISAYIKRWDGRNVFFMEPHVLVKDKDGIERLYGRGHFDGKFCCMETRRHPDYVHAETSQDLGDTPQAKAARAGSTLGASQEHGGSTQGALKEHVGSTLGALEGHFGNTNESTSGSTDELEQVYKNDDLTEALATKWLTERGQIAPSIRISRLAVDPNYPNYPFLAVEPATKQHQEQEQTQEQKQARKTALDFSSSRPTEEAKTPAAMYTDKSKTIGEHFAQFARIDVESISDGRITDEDNSNFDEPDLRKCIADSVNDRAEQPYCGITTNAMLMGVVMSQMMKLHKKKCPPMWLPVLKAMRAKPEIAREINPTFRHSNSAMKNLEPSPFHIANGYERCEDEIWRAVIDRAEQGFTLKDTYEYIGKTYNIWRKS